MELLTPELEQQLRKAKPNKMQPLAKFFNPAGAQTWLVCALESDGDTLWGYADLGLGCVEYGTISLSELRGVRIFGGALGIERDLHIDLTKCKPAVDILSLETLSGNAFLRREAA